MSGTVARILGNLADTLGTTATANVNFDSDGLFVDSVNNRVGIGTSSPTAKLDIASGNLAFSGTAQRITGDFSTATQSNRVLFQTTTAGGGTSVGTIPNATGTNSAFNAFGGPDPGNASFAQLRAGSDTSDVRLTSGITGTGTYYPMTFYTGGSERMRLDTSGNVGIGTSSPGVKLDVNGVIRSTGTSAILAISKRSTGTGDAWGIYSQSGELNLYDYIAASSRLVIDTSGNVGIGTSSPSSKLEVSGQINGSPIYIKSGGSTSTLFYDTALLLSQSGTGERLRIDSSGNVGIGTSSPAGKVSTERASGSAGWAYHVKTTGISNDSGIFMTASNNFEMVLRDSSTNLSTITNNGNNLVLSTGGTERARIDSSGRLGIGTSSPSQKLEVFASANSLQIESIVRNDQAGSGVAAIGFNVSSSGAAETTSTKAGIGLVRSNAYGVGSLCFYNNGTSSAGNFTTADERMRIDTSGNVGIGTSSPTTTLDVNGTIKGRAVGSEGGELQLNNPANASVGLYIDVSIANTARIFSLENNSSFQIGQLSGTGGTISLYTAAAERLRIGSSGQFGIGGANYGTSGQVLTSGGSAAAPSWATVTSTGRLINMQVFTSSGTYTRGSGVTTAVVFAVGGGGGGGGNAVGGSGGTTSFGSHVTAVGGSGGGSAGECGAGGTGGTGATISIKGNPGSTPYTDTGSINTGGSGGGQGGGITASAGVRGGGGSGRSNLGNQGSGGGQGETSIKYTATVGATETVTIGGAGTSSGGTAGGPGYIIVYEYS